MKFKVKITLKAEKTFDYEIEADSERSAGDKAFDKAIDEFTATGSDTEEENCEVEQQTAECEECGKEYNIPTNDRSQSDCPEACPEDYSYCVDCGAKITAELNK